MDLLLYVSSASCLSSDDLNAHKLVARGLVCDFSQQRPATNKGGESDGECAQV